MSFFHKFLPVGIGAFSAYLIHSQTEIGKSSYYTCEYFYKYLTKQNPQLDIYQISSPFLLKCMYPKYINIDSLDNFDLFYLFCHIYDGNANRVSSIINSIDSEDTLLNINNLVEGNQDLVEQISKRLIQIRIMNQSVNVKSNDDNLRLKHIILEGIGLVGVIYTYLKVFVKD